MASNTTRSPAALRVRFSEASMRQAEADLVGVANGMPKAIAGAINKVLGKAKTSTVNELTNLLTAKRGNILGRVKIHRQDRATPQKLDGRVSILQRRIGLVNFKHTEKRKKRGWGTKKSGTGVTVQIYKSGGTLSNPNAFLAVGKKDQAGGKGNKHIFEREGRFGPRPARFPIIRLNGVSLMTEFENRKDMQGRVRARIATEMDKELASQVNRLLGRPKAFAPTP
jgi:hypothetical protein